jgi:outer membrane protein assembly factor BamB
MTSPARAARRLILCCALLCMLSGCDKAKSLFSDEDNTPPLKGERISVLQLQKDLVADPALASQGVALPDAWVNKFWPQRGGYPNHALGQLSLGTALKPAWKAGIAAGDRRTPLTAMPIVADSTVFALDGKGDLSAFDLGNGKRKWRVTTVPKGEEDSGAVGGGIAYSSGRLYATSGYKYLAALNPADGAVIWKAPLPAPARAAPTVMEDKVYVVTLDNHLLVFGAENGQPQWNYAGVSETTNLLGSASPAADQSLIVLPLSSGEIVGLRPENGQVVWEDNLSSVRRTGSLASISDIKGLPVIDQGVVYAASFSGRMVALDQVTGQRLWQREIGSAETPWAAGDTVFVMSSEQQLVALTRSGGEIRWVTALPRYEKDDREKPVIWSGPVLAGGRLLLVSTSEKIAEIDPQDGKILKQSDLGGSADLPPLVAENTLIVLTKDGEIRAFR